MKDNVLNLFHNSISRRSHKFMAACLVSTLCCFAAPSGFAQNSPTNAFDMFGTSWDSAENSGALDYASGNYTDAETQFKLALQIAKNEHAKNNHLTMSWLLLGQTFKDEGKYTESEDCIKQAMQAIKNDLGEDAKEMSIALNNLASVYVQWGRYSESEDLFKRALSIAEAKNGPKSPDNSVELTNLAKFYIGMGKYDEAQELIERGRANYKGPHPEKIPYYALIVFTDGMWNEAQGRYTQAEKLCKSAIAIGVPLIGKNNTIYLSAIIKLADLNTKQGKYKDATTLLKEAQEIAARILKPNSPENLQLLLAGLSLFAAEGNYQQALPVALKAQQFAETVHSDDRLAACLVQLAKIDEQQGQYAAAESLLQRALTLTKKALGDQHFRVAEVQQELGHLYEQQGSYNKAREMLENALALYKTTLAPGHTEIGEADRMLAKVYAGQDKFDQAETLYIKSLAIAKKALDPDSPKYADALRDAADFYLLTKKTAKAATLVQQALKIDEKAQGESSPQAASDLDCLAQIYKAENQADKAKELAKRSEEIKKTMQGGASLADAANAANGAKESMKTAMSNVTGKWALVIGISEFKDSTINLKYAAKDAADFSNFLVEKENFQPDHVKLLVNDDATQKNIYDKLNLWLGQQARPDDLVLIYISTHGSGSVKEVGSAVNFVVASDTNKFDLETTGIPMQFLSNMIKNHVKSQRVVLILDVCHGGAAASDDVVAMAGDGQTASPDGKGLYRSALPATTPTAAATMATAGAAVFVPTGQGQAVLSSSCANQVSWESKNYENSVFTHRLIECLEHTTTLTQAYDALKDAVMSEVLHDRGELQIPVLNCTGWSGGDPVISAVPAPSRSMESAKSKDSLTLTEH